MVNQLDGHFPEVKEVLTIAQTFSEAWRLALPSLRHLCLDHTNGILEMKRSSHSKPRQS